MRFAICLGLLSSAMGAQPVDFIVSDKQGKPAFGFRELSTAEHRFKARVSNCTDKHWSSLQFTLHLWFTGDPYPGTVFVPAGELDPQQEIDVDVRLPSFGSDASISDYSITVSGGQDRPTSPQSQSEACTLVTKTARKWQVEEAIANKARAERLKAQEQKAEQKARQEVERKTEERRQLMLTCAAVYKQTIDRKRSDLTVRQEQQVAACIALGLYPPK